MRNQASISFEERAGQAAPCGRKARLAGFSLVELMIALLVLSAMTVTGFELAQLAQKSFQKSMSSSNLLDSGVRALGQMTKEIRMAGFPSAASFSSSAVTAHPGIAANSVTTASAYDLVFEADIDGDGQVEQVEYVLPANSQTLLRCVTKKNPDGTLATSSAFTQPFLDHVQNQVLSQQLFTWQTDPSSTKPFPQNISTIYINAILQTTDSANSAADSVTITAASRRMNP